MQNKGGLRACSAIVFRVPDSERITLTFKQSSNALSPYLRASKTAFYA